MCAFFVAIYIIVVFCIGLQHKYVSFSWRHQCIVVSNNILLYWVLALDCSMHVAPLLHRRHHHFLFLFFIIIIYIIILLFFYIIIIYIIILHFFSQPTLTAANPHHNCHSNHASFTPLLAPFPCSKLWLKKGRKKNPNAPKRPMTAFLLFAATRRKEIKPADPTATVTRRQGFRRRVEAVG